MRQATLIVLALMLCFAIAAQIAQAEPAQIALIDEQIPGIQNTPALAQPNLQILTNLNRNELLLHLNISKTYEGVFYDGSIPMLVESLDIVRQDTILPTDKYVPIVGPTPTGLKWGDRIRVTGIMKQPASGDPASVQGQSVFLQVQAATNIKIATPGLLPRYDPSRFHVVAGPILAAPVISKKYAVLISGGASYADNHIRYWNDLKAMYHILRNKGYLAANIYVLYANGVPRDGSMPVYRAATKGYFNALFHTLSTTVKANDSVYIMLNDHGGRGSGDPSGDETVTHTDEVLYMWTGENMRMTDDEFAFRVNLLPPTTKVIIQMKQCFSGGFIDDLTKPNRIIMASASATQVSWSKSTLDFGEFTFWYFAALTGNKPDGSGAVNADTDGNGKVSIIEAYTFARAHDTAPETPSYEDNGVQPDYNGPVPNGGEGALGAATYL